MWWQEDDLVDKLNNAARPIPGMEKPDMERLTLNGSVRRKNAMAADEQSARVLGETSGTKSSNVISEGSTPLGQAAGPLFLMLLSLSIYI